MEKSRKTTSEVVFDDIETKTTSEVVFQDFSTNRHPSPSPVSPTPRRPYIDWLRGVAVLFMIEWHVVDAWSTDASRQGGVFTALALIGGTAAPLFLFLAGLAIPFAAASQQRKGKSLREAAWALQKRGWQVFLFAHIFRLQSFLGNPWARVDSIFKPDILNILGLGMVVTAWCWGRTDALKRRVAWLLVPAFILVVITPLSRVWWWPTLLHPRAEAYIRPNGGWGQFALFPWLAFVLVGCAVGVWIARSRPAADERRFHGQLAQAGAAIVIVGTIAAFVPSPFNSSFWTTSLSFFLIRTGVMTMALSGAWWWMSRANAHRWSPVVLFGQTSLFVYWVHVELAYGMFSAAWKRSLTLGETALAYLAFTALMLVAARWWARRTAAGPWIPEHMRA